MKELHFCFQLSKLKLFYVSIRPKTIDVCGKEDASKQRTYQDGFKFATRAMELFKNKGGYSRCGQCQNETTFGFSTARRFWEKWNPMQLSKITEEQFSQIMTDLQPLKDKYNYIEGEHRFTFEQIVELSKQRPKQGVYRLYV